MSIFFSVIPQLPVSDAKFWMSWAERPEPHVLYLVPTHSMDALPMQCY